MLQQRHRRVIAVTGNSLLLAHVLWRCTSSNAARALCRSMSIPCHSQACRYTVHSQLTLDPPPPHSTQYPSHHVYPPRSICPGGMLPLRLSVGASPQCCWCPSCAAIPLLSTNRQSVTASPRLPEQRALIPPSTGPWPSRCLSSRRADCAQWRGAPSGAWHACCTAVWPEGCTCTWPCPCSLCGKQAA